jgi:hypothetical protein
MSFNRMQREKFRAESAQKWRAAAGKVCKEEEEVAAVKSECRVKNPKGKRVSPLNMPAPNRSWAMMWRAKQKH